MICESRYDLCVFSLVAQTLLKVLLVLQLFSLDGAFDGQLTHSHVSAQSRKRTNISRIRSGPAHFFIYTPRCLLFQRQG